VQPKKQKKLERRIDPEPHIEPKPIPAPEPVREITEVVMELPLTKSPEQLRAEGFRIRYNPNYPNGFRLEEID